MERFELVEGTSSKFWEVSVEGSAVTLRWGRIGARSATTKTKDYPSPAKAAAERDKLVREKTTKGYRLVSAEVAASRPPAGASGRGVRADVSVYNEATGFLVTHRAMLGKGIEPGAGAWAEAVKAGDLVPVELVQDDPFCVRVVANADLSPEEEGEWVGRFTWKLRVPDGKLAIVGGAEAVMASGPGEVDSDCVRLVDVPPGEYRATLLGYVHGVNGEHLLDEARGGRKGERVGAWFRRTRPGAQPPVWLRRWCRAAPREDPGHREEWAGEPPASEVREEDRTSYVDFLLHLAPLAGEALALPPLEADGFFPLGSFAARVPALCPLGIHARSPHAGAAGDDTTGEDEARDGDRDDGGAEASERAGAPPDGDSVDVLARVRDRALTRVAGGPVAHPLAELARLYKLAWLATDAADPEIRVDLPPGASFPAKWPKVEGAHPRSSPGALRVGFEPSGAKWAQIGAVAKVAKHLAALPEGSTLELLTAPHPEILEKSDPGEPDQDPRLGQQRYRGTVRGGTLEIAETYPALDAATLREALDLVASVEAGKRLALRDEAEGREVARRLGREAYLFTDNPVVVKGLTIGLTRKDPSFLHFVAVALFRVRWRDVWPSYVEDEGAEDAFAEAMKALAEKAGAAIAKAAAPRGARERVLEGKVGVFEKIDLAKERPLEADTVEETDAQLAELGYVALGDLVCARFPDVLFRGYAKEGGDTWGALIVGVLESTFDFVTQYAKGAGLTTTLKEGPTKDEPAKGLYRTRCPKLDFNRLGKLHAEHEKRRSKLVAKLGAPLPAPPDLRAFAEAVDRGVSRELGL